MKCKHTDVHAFYIIGG